MGNLLVGRFRLSVTTDDRSLFADGLQVGGDVTANWTELTPTSWSIVGSDAPMEFINLGDNSLLVDVTKGYSAPDNILTTYIVTTVTTLTGITGIRLETLPHPSLVGGGPGTVGNFWLSYLQVDMSLPGYEFCISPPVGDLDGNCWVDLYDFVILAQNWLE